MDDSPTPTRAGGDVEPLDKPRQPTPPVRLVPPGQRFELRDPFAEVTHRSNSFEEMVTKADRLGAIRFAAIDPDGTRSTVSKVSGQWLRPQPTRDTKALSPVREIRTPPSTSQVKAQVDRPATPDPERAARVAALEVTLNERYVIRRAPIRIGDVTIGQTAYRHRGDISRVAFTESASRLSTDTNSPSVARSMVDVAESRNWQALRVSGSDDFKRMVWLEASLRNVRTVGYEPVPGDHDLLRKEREARSTNRIEPHANPAASAPPAAKQSARGGGRKAVLAAIEAVLVAQKVPVKQREAVMTAAADNLAQRIRSGENPRVKVYDPTAQVQRQPVVPPRIIHRAHERVGPTR